MADRTIKTIRIKVTATEEQLTQAIAERRARGEWPVDAITPEADRLTEPPPLADEENR